MFSGSFVALVTPFNNDYSVDYNALEKLIRFQIESGTQGIVICSSTGEGLLLTQEERIGIIKQTINISTIPVLVGCSSCSTTDAINNIKIAQDLGADGVLVTAPYYVKPTQSGIIQHFEVIVQSTDIPIVVYNIPSRVTINLELDTLLHLSKLPNIVALKDSTTQFDTLSMLHILAPNLPILSGDDATLPACLAHGASGTISAAANAYPKLIYNIVSAWNTGNIQEFKKFIPTLTYVSKAISITTNPIPLKYILSKMKLTNNIVRPPLFMTSSNQQIEIDKIILHL